MHRRTLHPAWEIFCLYCIILKRKLPPLDMGSLVDRQLASREMTFDQLNDSPEVLNALEEEMIEPLCRTLRQSSCSGAFVLLDSTVNTRMEGAGHSRAGLYVQKSGADTPTVPLLLYRGSAEVGKTHSVMPHRKWRMEFQTDQFPDYDRWMTPSDTPLYQSYTLTERFSIPGTSEEVQLFVLPLRGQDGTMYGLCGFKISESYFKQSFAQPTGFDRLSCLLAPAGSKLNAGAALSSGTTDGYYHALRDTLVLRSMGGGLTQLIGADGAYASFRLRSGSLRKTGGSPGGGWTSCRWSAGRCRPSFPGWQTCAATSRCPMPSRPSWRAFPA